MIEITITQEKWSGRVWVATIRQTAKNSHGRILQRSFATNPEAWQWAQKITQAWKEGP
jgi:hypothetical protein